MVKLTSYWHSLNFVSLLLSPLSLIFCIVAKIRKKLYQWHWLKSYRSTTPIVVVGNIYVGGNGKTPLVIHLIEQFKKMGYSPGVVSRGYGAKNAQLDKHQSVPVDTSFPAIQFGDEPWMIAKRTGSPVVIGRNRSQAVDFLLKHNSCDIVISDDGMQHYAMQRDFEICVVDAEKQFGNHLCLPAGPLRERVTRLKSVDFIVFNGLEKHLAERFKKKSCHMQMIFQPLVALNHPELSKNVEEFSGKTVHAIAGIGIPSRFFNQLKQLNIHVIEHAFPDHYDYQDEDFRFADDYPIIMTEKDAVKCQSFKLLNAWYIPVKIELTEQIATRIIASLNETYDFRRSK